MALPLRAARVKLRAEEMVPTLTLSESVQRGVAAIWSLQETVADDLREALEAAYPLSLDDDLAEQVASTVDTLARSEIEAIVSALSRLSGIASGGYVPLDDLCRGVYETMRDSEDHALVLSESEQVPFRGRLKSLMSTRSIHLWGRARLVFTEHERFEAEFAALAERWLADTAHVSSLSRIVMHPAYQQIIGMGRDALAPILRWMRQGRPGYWFWALETIARETPVTAEMGGRIKEMKRAWIAWGEERGLV